MNAPFGHNETAVRLGLLADDARTALAIVAKGEDDALAGWLAYGAALNEGRALFSSNEFFGQWVEESGLYQVGTNEMRREDRIAAMWAAASPDQFAEARAAGNARTVRGIYAKWQEINAEAEAAKARAEAEAERAIAEAERAKAEAARAQADAERAEAAARAKAEADALKAAQKAKDDEDRRAAQAVAAAEAEAKAEAERRAKAAEAEAKAANKSAKAADKSAKKSDSKAKKADKRAASAKIGDAAAGDNYRTNNTGENEWYTPHEFVELARAVMGGIDLDPASCAEANEVVKAATFYTAQDDGLARDWRGRVWLNPPYSRDLMPSFCEKLASHVDAGEVTDAILVSHNNTETGWFHRLAASCAAACFPGRRIRFYRGEKLADPVNGQVFFYFGRDVEAFKREFGQVGWVVVSA